jgi:hypothetical protein
MLNRAWHAAHPMPRPATLADRVRWHVAHAKACACRPIPATVAAELRRRSKPSKTVVPRRRSTRG